MWRMKRHIQPTGTGPGGRGLCYFTYRGEKTPLCLNAVCLPVGARRRAMHEGTLQPTCSCQHFCRPKQLLMAAAVSMSIVNQGKKISPQPAAKQACQAFLKCPQGQREAPLQLIDETKVMRRAILRNMLMSWPREKSCRTCVCLTVCLCVCECCRQWEEWVMAITNGCLG